MALKNLIKKDSEDSSSISSGKKDTIKRMLAEIEKLNAQLNAEKEIRTALNDKLIHLSEEIGDLRRSIIEKEKKISEIDVKATKSADMVKEVQPEKLFSEVKKEEAKIEALKIGIDANKTMMRKIVKDLKEIRSKMKIYRGSEEVMKLYSDIKKDIGTLNKLKSRVESDADKVESLFIEIQKKIKDQKSLSDNIDNLEKLVRENNKRLGTLEFLVKSKASKQDIRKLINLLSSKPTILDKLLNRDKDKFFNTKEIIDAFKEETDVLDRISDIEKSMNEYKSVINEAKNKVDITYREIDQLIKDNSNERKKTDNLIADINKRIDLLFKEHSDSKKEIIQEINRVSGDQELLKKEFNKELDIIREKVLGKSNYYDNNSVENVFLNNGSNSKNNIVNENIKSKSIVVKYDEKNKQSKSSRKLLYWVLNSVIFGVILFLIYEIIEKVMLVI